MQVFSFFHKDMPELNVDLFAHHPIPFGDLWSKSVVMNLDGIPIRVCSVDHLIELKRIAGRHKDLADIEQLVKTSVWTRNLQPLKRPTIPSGWYRGTLSRRRSFEPGCALRPRSGSRWRKNCLISRERSASPRNVKAGS